MPELIREKMCAEVETEIVVFLIGMRINKAWKIWQWLPVARAMARMLAELSAHPELGLLSFRSQIGFRDLSVVQYWRSAAHLQAFAHATHRSHMPAWRDFYARVGSSGDVGIWHETYVVPRENLETVYMNMPRFGLGLAGDVFPATGPRASAAKRLRREPRVRQADGAADGFILPG